MAGANCENRLTVTFPATSHQRPLVGTKLCHDDTSFNGHSLIYCYHADNSPLSIWPHLFCGVGHEKRRGEQLKWSLAFTLYIGSLACAQPSGPVHTARFGRVFFGVFSLGLCFVCPFVLFPWAVESSPLQFLVLA